MLVQPVPEIHQCGRLHLRFGIRVAGGVLIAAGLGMLGASIRDRAGVWNTQATGSFVVATLALAGAVVAAVVLII